MIIYYLLFLTYLKSTIFGVVVRKFNFFHFVFRNDVYDIFKLRPSGLQINDEILWFLFFVKWACIRGKDNICI